MHADALEPWMVCGVQYRVAYSDEPALGKIFGTLEMRRDRLREAGLDLNDLSERGKYAVNWFVRSFHWLLLLGGNLKKELVYQLDSRAIEFFR